MIRVASAPIVEGGAVLQGMGRELLAATYAAAQSLKLYPLENATVQKSLGELHRVAKRIVELEGAIELRLVGDFFFLNDARLRLDLSNFTTFSFLAGALSQIRSYVFQPYTMVNDHRTEIKVTDVQSVMDGHIDPFIEAYLMQQSDPT